MSRLSPAYRRTSFAVSLVILGGMMIWATSNVFALIKDSRAITHTSQVNQVLERTLFMMSDAETDERAYLITGEIPYLQHYRQTVGHNGVFVQLALLHHITGGEPHLQQNLTVVQTLIEERLREMQKAVTTRQKRGMEAARAVVIHNLKLGTLDKMQAVIGAMQERENQRLSSQTQQRDNNAQNSVLSFAFSACLVVGLLSISGRVLQREVAERQRSEAEVRQLNGELEARVQQRTEHLEHAQRQIKSHVQELENLNIEMLERLAHAGEFRDDDTGQHTQRVGYIAYLLAQKLELAEPYARQIQQAARLHDLGKIGVSDLILLKPGKLTDEEFTRMKEHTTIGAALFEDGHSDVIRIAQQIAGSHHERWDGRGYPQGLQGEEISLPARLVAVADVFDALTHERPYKKAWPAQEAVAEIAKQSGSQFDPRVVAAFLTLPHETLV